MANPLSTKAFLQPAKAAAMCTALRAETRPPPPIPPFLLVQNLSSKQIAPTDNVRPKLHDKYSSSMVKGLRDKNVQYELLVNRVYWNDSFEICFKYFSRSFWKILLENSILMRCHGWALFFLYHSITAPQDAHTRLVLQVYFDSNTVQFSSIRTFRVQL